jgi:hypothetical protein
MCLCCNRPTKNLLGDRCAKQECSCEGLFCPHDNTRLKFMKSTLVYEQYYGTDYLLCTKCDCGFFGDPALEDTSFLIGMNCVIDNQIIQNIKVLN